MKRRLLKYLHEHLPDVLLILSAVAIFATVRFAFRLAGRQGASTDAIREITDVTGSIIGIMLAVLGALAAYRRFLKGRVFATRAKLDLASSPVRWLDADGDLPRRLLHAVDVMVENVGDRTLWEPQIFIQVRTLDDEPCEQALSTDGVKSKLKEGGLHGVEPGESVAYHYRFAVREEVPVFKVTAELVLGERDAWHRATTVANCLSPATDT